jgi:hypothetical protein
MEKTDCFHLQHQSKQTATDSLADNRIEVWSFVFEVTQTDSCKNALSAILDPPVMPKGHFSEHSCVLYPVRAASTASPCRPTRPPECDRPRGSERQREAEREAERQRGRESKRAKMAREKKRNNAGNSTQRSCRRYEGSDKARIERERQKRKVRRRVIQRQRQRQGRRVRETERQRDTQRHTETERHKGRQTKKRTN